MDILPIEQPETIKHQAMKKAGATREVAYKAMSEGMQANKVWFNKDGDMVEEPDHSTRHKFMDSYLRAVGDIKPDVAVDNRKVQINMNGIPKEMIQGLMDMAQDVKEQLRGLKISGRQTGEIIDITPG